MNNNETTATEIIDGLAAALNSIRLNLNDALKIQKELVDLQFKVTENIKKQIDTVDYFIGKEGE